MSNGETFSVEAQCRTCNGFGVRVGPHQFEEDGTVCSTCGGEGKEVLVLTKFTGRKIHDFVSTVSTPDYKNTISYPDFLIGKLPQAKSA